MPLNNEKNLLALGNGVAQQTQTPSLNSSTYIELGGVFWSLLEGNPVANLSDETVKDFFSKKVKFDDPKYATVHALDAAAAEKTISATAADMKKSSQIIEKVAEKHLKINMAEAEHAMQERGYRVFAHSEKNADALIMICKDIYDLHEKSKKETYNIEGNHYFVLSFAYKTLTGNDQDHKAALRYMNYHIESGAIVKGYMTPEEFSTMRQLITDMKQGIARLKNWFAHDAVLFLSNLFSPSKPPQHHKGPKFFQKSEKQNIDEKSVGGLQKSIAELKRADMEEKEKPTTLENYWQIVIKLAEAFIKLADHYRSENKYKEAMEEYGRAKIYIEKRKKDVVTISAYSQCQQPESLLAEKENLLERTSMAIVELTDIQEKLKASAPKIPNLK